MTSVKPQEDPSQVAAEEGEVIVDGPDGVAVSMTPEAAIETSERLHRGGIVAKGQQAGEKARRRPIRG